MFKGRRVKVIKSSWEHELEERVNAALVELGESVVDIKVAGAFDGKDERFVVVIVYEA